MRSPVIGLPREVANPTGHGIMDGLLTPARGSFSQRNQAVLHHALHDPRPAYPQFLLGLAVFMARACCISD